MRNTLQYTMGRTLLVKILHPALVDLARQVAQTRKREVTLRVLVIDQRSC